jgi:hypothetical protein
MPPPNRGSMAKFVQHRLVNHRRVGCFPSSPAQDDSVMLAAAGVRNFTLHFANHSRTGINCRNWGLMPMPGQLLL